MGTRLHRQPDTGAAVRPDETARSEQAFYADGGKTWETHWINLYTRISE